MYDYYLTFTDRETEARRGLTCLQVAHQISESQQSCSRVCVVKCYPTASVHIITLTILSIGSRESWLTLFKPIFDQFILLCLLLRQIY